MSIRFRIIFLVLMAFVAILSIGGFSIYESSRNAGQVGLVTQKTVPSTLASADLVSRLKDVQLAAMTYTTAPDDATASQAKADLDVARSVLGKALDLQVREATDSTQTKLTKEASEALADYFKAIDDTVGFKQQGHADIAQANFFGNVAQYEMVLQQIVDTLRIEKNRSNDRAIAFLNHNLHMTTELVDSVTGFSVLLLGFLSVVLYRKIVQPIGRMQAMMSSIAEHQDFSRRVPVDRRDEIGRSIEAFNTMLAKIEERSAQLRAKTHDMQTMLQHMPQGILTITHGNKVHQEFSAYLSSILETDDIADRDVMELMFDATTLSSDVRSQIETITSTCVGEDEMNFELNAHLLVGEIEKNMPDGRMKFLDLNWSPIVGEDGNIDRLMVCVRDITELRKLASEAKEQRRELEMIGEILAITQEKFHEFIEGSLRLVDDNEHIIRQHVDADAEAVHNLFRNMHTVKGNARTYGLKHLTQVLHDAEQMYDALRQVPPDMIWDQTMLLDELALVRNSIESYARINEVSLGRKGPGRRGSVERYLMVDRQQITETLNRLETINPANVHELVAARDAVHRTLRLMGTEPIQEVLGTVLTSLPSLALELGKCPPHVQIEDHGYVVRSQLSGLLKNVFMHLFRNAMDHGLESAEERKAQGKPEAGTILLDTTVQQGVFRLVIRDDGRGLALSRIRSRALNRGWLQEGESVSDEDLADYIFKPGFSTVEQVTEVSGRGVGMDAVKDFLKREQGGIELVFTDHQEGADFRAFALHVTLPAQYAVSREEVPVRMTFSKVAKEAEVV